MEYITRTLESDPGMSQREALISLQKAPQFKEGTIISGVRRRGNQWVADLLEPKTAEFPPKNDGGDENGATDTSAPDSSGPPSDDKPAGDSSPDGPPSDSSDDSPNDSDGDSPSEGDKPSKSKGSTEDAILHTLTQILHALQGGGAPEGLGGPDALGPGPGGIDGPPPPKGGPAGGPPVPGKGAPAKFPPRPMKPGDTPPGGTPVGAPAFSHTKEANPSIAPGMGTPVPSGQAGPVGPQATGGVCPQCGGPEPCAIHGGAAGLNQAVASYSGRAATLTLTHEGSDIKAAVEEARPVAQNYGYQVKQAKHSEDGSKVHILVSRR